MGPTPSDFIDEEDLNTFEGWLKYQARDHSEVSPDEMAMLRSEFDKATARQLANRKVGPKLLPLRLAGDHLYAVAVQDGADLWLALWFRRNKKGEFVIVIPRAEPGWDQHATYHVDGRYHWKSYKRVRNKTTRQPLTSPFRGTEHLGSFAGYEPKGVGAVCDPAAFNGIVEVPLGVLGPRHGSVVIDLVEPGHELLTWPEPIVLSKVFCDFTPWVVFRVAASN
jgi:hypothetical protein